jgi:putative intracellular protease/amidase
MQIAILLYDGMTVLDAIGPYEVLQSVPGTEVCFVASTRGEKRADFKRLGLVADYTLADVPHPDILVVPGTPFPQAVTGDPAVLEWIRAVHETTIWTTSVCTGALGLGAAGLLQGKRATTHWLALDALAEFGATPVEERSRDADLTAGRVSGTTWLALVGEQARRPRGQLIIEYDPQPPYDAGDAQGAGGPRLGATRTVRQPDVNRRPACRDAGDQASPPSEAARGLTAARYKPRPTSAPPARW